MDDYDINLASLVDQYGVDDFGSNLDPSSINDVLADNFPDVMFCDDNSDCFDIDEIFRSSGITSDFDVDSFLDESIGYIDSCDVCDDVQFSGSGKERILTKNVRIDKSKRRNDGSDKVIVVGRGIGRNYAAAGLSGFGVEHNDAIAGPSGVDVRAGDGCVGGFRWTPVKRKNERVKYRDGKVWKDLYDVCRLAAIKYYLLYRKADCLSISKVDDEIIQKLKDKGGCL